PLASASRAETVAYGRLGARRNGRRGPRRRRDNRGHAPTRPRRGRAGLRCQQILRFWARPPRGGRGPRVELRQPAFAARGRAERWRGQRLVARAPGARPRATRGRARWPRRRRTRRRFFILRRDARPELRLTTRTEQRGTRMDTEQGFSHRDAT